MSYVKGLVIWKGKPHIFEVHGSEWMLNVRKDHDPKTFEVEKVIPDSVKTLEDYRKFVKQKKLTLSGTKEERFQLGIPEIKTDEDKEKFFRKLRKFDLRDEADNPPEGFYGNLIVDLDNNLLIDSEHEWYANYVKFLPDNWKSALLNKDKFNDAWVKAKVTGKLKEVI